MNLGKTILELRRQKHVTQEDLAAELGVTAAAVSKWENGYTLPDILMLCALADYFGVTTDELLGRVQEWKYAVIAAQTEELGQQIASMLREFGYVAQGIFTDYDSASEVAQNNDSIRYVIAGFHTGWYGGCEAAPTLVVVAPTDQQILESFHSVFKKYLD